MGIPAGSHDYGHLLDKVYGGIPGDGLIFVAANKTK